MSINVSAQRPPDTELATYPRGGSGSRNRVVNGAGMLTPSTDFTWRGELFRAGVSRVSPLHEICRDPKAAAMLVPCWSQETDERVLEVLWRTGRTWEPVGQTRTEPAPTAPPRRTPIFGVDYGPSEISSPRPRDDDVLLAPLVAPKSVYIASPELERQIRESNAERSRRRMDRELDV
jgi:hypothetical protein